MMLPDRPTVRQTVTRMAGRLREQGSQVQVLRVRLTDADEHAALIVQQQAERDVEYAEVVSRVPELLVEIEQETARGRATYTEVEESEADLERFQRWMARIAERDYFARPAVRRHETRSGGAKRRFRRSRPRRCRPTLAYRNSTRRRQNPRLVDDSASSTAIEQGLRTCGGPSRLGSG